MTPDPYKTPHYYKFIAHIQRYFFRHFNFTVAGLNAPLNSIRAQCRKEKMRYLQEQALRKVIEGVTSIQEVMRVTTEAKPAKPAKKADVKQAK